MANKLKELLEVQSLLNVPKDSYNSFGKYSYRSCESILAAVKPLLQERGILLTFHDKTVREGERYYIVSTAVLRDIETGEKIEEATNAAREEDSKKGMDASQVTGSATSYARKYALQALFLIDDNKDSDATNTQQRYKAPVKDEPKEEPEACPEWYEMVALIERYVNEYGLDKLDTWRKLGQPIGKQNSEEALKVIKDLREVLG